MKAVMSHITPDVAAFRSQTGADRWDEVWEGVLHMVPMPNRHHQELEFAMEEWLQNHWARPLGAKVYHEINLASIGGWPRDYRVPDLVLLQPDRLHIDKNEYFEGAPSVVVEIRSPDDESYEKLEWYAKLGVPEAWIVDRDTKVPEVYLLTPCGYERSLSSEEGRVTSPSIGVEMQSMGERLAMQVTGDLSTRELLPRS